MTDSSKSSKTEFKDSLRKVALAVAIVAAIPLVSTYLISKAESFKPDFLARVFLYGFTLVNLAMLLVLVFVLGRNLIKLFIERRRSVLGAKLKMKLVVIFMSFAILPSALIVLVGSNLISSAVERWFSHPVERVLVGSQEVVEAYYRERQDSAIFYARRLSREVSDERLLQPARLSRLRRIMEARLTQYRLDMIHVLGGEQTLLTLARPGLPTYNPDSSLRLAELGLRGDESLQQDSLREGTLVQYVSPVFAVGTRDVQGAVVVSHYIPQSLTATLEMVNLQANVYQQAEAQKEPIQDVYLSFFLMVSLLVLFSSTWVGLYLAKRITVPIGQLAEATERIMAGEFDQPVSAIAVDEIGLLMESFNRMTAQLKGSQQRLEASRVDLEQKNRELDRRRRYIETVLENITTGIVSLDRDCVVTRMNRAALRLLQLDSGLVGRHYRDVFGSDDLTPLRETVDEMGGMGHAPCEVELDLKINERELHLSVYLTSLTSVMKEPSGSLIVLDDLTQLLRAQKVAAWREVARRLAHEIKNPLTPIQLSAQRIRKHFRSRTDEFPKVLEEGTSTIIDEVDALKSLVDEFSQFARMPNVSAEPQALEPILRACRELYDGLFKKLTIEERFEQDVPHVRIDPELMRRVFINLVDNAIDAMDGSGHIVISTSFDPELGVARVSVADDGPGVDPEARDKLFVPYYSTKKRGSGLGLAIVSRLVAEHRGRVRIEENQPRGAIFVIELPVEVTTTSASDVAPSEPPTRPTREVTSGQ